jgi:hypothetical protein
MWITVGSASSAVARPTAAKVRALASARTPAQARHTCTTANPRRGICAHVSSTQDTQPTTHTRNMHQLAIKQATASHGTHLPAACPSQRSPAKLNLLRFPQHLCACTKRVSTAGHAYEA